LFSLRMSSKALLSGRGSGGLGVRHKADALKRGATLAEQLDLTGLDQRLAKMLSGGQRRRLDIALGLIHSPGLVFLDEPSTGLDPQSRANLWDHIRRLRDQQGATVFLTTHYLDEADALSDRLIVIDDGEIVAEGTPDSLKARVSGDSVPSGSPWRRRRRRLRSRAGSKGRTKWSSPMAP
jgi:ABC-2 type transport system ATP-binding protein